MDKIKSVGFCDFCQKLKVNKTHFIYRLDFSTNQSDYNIGILAVSNELSDWLMEQGYYLSATQVILLRPDIT